MKMAGIDTLFLIIFSGVPRACRKHTTLEVHPEQIYFPNHVNNLVELMVAFAGCCTTLLYICSYSSNFAFFFYLLCSPVIHSSFPAASAAPPADAAAPPADGI